jgi:hypothetical protein
MTAMMCWLRPETERVCAQPLAYRIIAKLIIAGEPTKFIPFGYACGPHLAATRQEDIFLKHFDVFACMLPEPKPESFRPEFGFARMET